MSSYNNYDFTKGKFIFNSFDKSMNLINQKNVSLINNGIIHSIGFTGDKIIIPDMPMKVDLYDFLINSYLYILIKKME